MKHFMRLIAVCVLALAAFPAHAAVDFSEQDVKNFLAAVPELDIFAGEIEKAGKEKKLDEAAKNTTEEENYYPYRRGIRLLKEIYPEDHAKLGVILQKYGFASPEEWAEKSDIMVHTYSALKMRAKDKGTMEHGFQMPPEIREKLPPEMKLALERREKLHAMAKSTPQAHIDAVQPHEKEIDAWIETTRARQAEKQGQQAKPNMPSQDDIKSMLERYTQPPAQPPHSDPAAPKAQ
jgi:hypothetical protein